MRLCKTGSKVNPPAPCTGCITDPAHLFHHLLPGTHRYTVSVKMATGGTLLGARSPAEVFSVVDSKDRSQVVKVVKQEDVSLGLVDPTTGR